MRPSQAVPTGDKPIRGDWLAVRQAAERSGVGYRTLYDWMQKGTVPFPWYLKGPGIRQFDSADIDSWVRTCKVPAGKLPGET